MPSLSGLAAPSPRVTVVVFEASEAAYLISGLPKSVVIRLEIENHGPVEWTRSQSQARHVSAHQQCMHLDVIQYRSVFHRATVSRRQFRRAEEDARRP